MTLSYGRSKSGTRVIKKTTKYPYKRYISGRIIKIINFNYF